MEERVLSDEEVITNFQNGKEEAFEIIVKRYTEQLKSFISRLIKSNEIIEDIVQETFFRVYMNKMSYKPIAKFSTWIYTIAINLAKMEIRNRNKYGLNSIFVPKENSSEEEIGIFKCDEDDPESRAHKKMLKEVVEKNINNLPLKFREPIILRDMNEFTYEEIGVMLKLPVGTVKSRINRGRKKLKKVLSFLNEK